jgi:hypothetical protein
VLDLKEKECEGGKIGRGSKGDEVCFQKIVSGTSQFEFKYGGFNRSVKASYSYTNPALFWPEFFFLPGLVLKGGVYKLI